MIWSKPRRRNELPWVILPSPSVLARQLGKSRGFTQERAWLARLGNISGYYYSQSYGEVGRMTNTKRIWGRSGLSLRIVFSKQLGSMISASVWLFLWIAIDKISQLGYLVRPLLRLGIKANAHLFLGYTFVIWDCTNFGSGCLPYLLASFRAVGRGLLLVGGRAASLAWPFCIILAVWVVRIG